MGDRVGQYIEEYHLVRRLGAGAFGEVYLGEHAHNQSRVAVKVLQLTHSNLKGFIKEASTTFRLKHPHIVQLLSFGISADDAPYLIMAYASNGTLRERHPKGTCLPLNTVISYLLPLADALQYAHDRRVVHRDVKPENVLIGPDNEVLLSDFGIAVTAPIDRSLSTQHLGGTAPYMAPEQIGGKPQPASDQYALGIMVYEWLCGVRPFQGNQWEILEQQRSSPPPPLREKRPDILLQAEEIILRTLAKDPQNRFASVQDFATALEQASRVRPSDPPLFSQTPIILSQPTLPSGQKVPLQSPLAQQPASPTSEKERLSPLTPFPQDMLTPMWPESRSSPQKRKGVQFGIIIGLIVLIIAAGIAGLFFTLSNHIMSSQSISTTTSTINPATTVVKRTLSPPPTIVVGISGQWNGTDSNGTRYFYSLTQVGNLITGTGSMNVQSSIDTVTIRGSISGNSVSLTVHVNQSNCDQQDILTLSPNGQSLTGNQRGCDGGSYNLGLAKR